jgi:DNA primase
MPKVRIDYQFLNDVCNTNIEIVFNELGLVFRKNGNEYRGSCPIHNGYNRSSFSYYSNIGRWKCWSCSCDKEHGSSPLGLVGGVLNKNFKDSVTWICDLFKLDPNNLPKKNEEAASILSFINKNKKHEVPKKIVYNEKYLLRLKKHDYFLKRGFTEETIDYFQGGFAEKKEMANRIVFPIRDILGDIIGFTGRVIYDKCPNCEMFHENGQKCYEGWSTWIKWKKNKGFSQKALYNLNNIRYNVEKIGSIVLVEGIPDLMRLHQIGVFNAVALLGGSATKDYFSTLMSLDGLRQIYLFGDNDKAGKKFIDDNLTKNEINNEKRTEFMSLSRYFNVKPVLIDGKKDIGEMTDDEANEVARQYNYFQ